MTEASHKMNTELEKQAHSLVRSLNSMFHLMATIYFPVEKCVLFLDAAVCMARHILPDQFFTQQCIASMFVYYVKYEIL